MEENKQFTEKQTQAGDDSGYSCTSTSTQSKYSVKSCHNQSGSSGDSCSDEQRPTTLKSTKKRTISTLKYKTIEQPDQTALNYVSDLINTINQESNKKKTKTKQINSTQFKPQINQIFSTDDVKQLQSTSKIEFDETKHLNGDTKINHDQNNTTFHHLANLYQFYHDHMNTKIQTSNSENEFTIKGTAIKEVNYQEILLKKLFGSTEIHDNIFGVIVSMSDGLIINTSNSIQKNMGYPSDMWQGRSFVDFIHPKDHLSFISYVTSVLTDPYAVSKQDDTSSVTFLKSKNNDGFYCNMRRSRSLNSGFNSPTQSNNHYQMCKLTMSFKDFTYLSASSSTDLAKRIKTPQPKLILIVNAQLVHSVYTCPEEILKNPVNFITKHNTLFEWCYVDHLITSHFGYLPQNIIGKSIFGYYNQEDVTTIKEAHENMMKDKSISYLKKSYRFKCQNGNFALVETEWSNFVNPWSGITEFFIGKHKVIQGPINPDVTNLAVHYKPEEKITDDEKNINEIYENNKKLVNKNIYEATEVSLRINNTENLNKSNENPKQNLPDETKNITDITHGIKRSNSNGSESISCKHTKKNTLVNSDSTIETQIQATDKKILVDTQSVANGTQIWSPHQYQIQQKSQTTANPQTLQQPDLPSQMHCYNNHKYYNAPIGNNLMPMKNNEYKSAYSLMDPCKLNQELLCNQLQSLAVPLSEKMPVINKIPQNFQILQPYLQYHNLVILQEPHQNVQLKPKTNPQCESPVPVIPNAMPTTTQKTTQPLQVHQEDVITSSNSKHKKEYGSLKSSSGWMDDGSSFYSSSLYGKTESSDQEQEDCSWPTEFNKTNISDKFNNNKRQPFWMENIESTPDLIFRYQIKLGDINETLRKDRAMLSTFTQPVLVNEQLKQLRMNMNVNGNSEDECFNLLKSQKERPISPE